ncbi:sensor histidine kinase [Sesbania bispinosa]|nr:sensor histidine kinase [Sesbania bispinosa]
MPTLPKLSPTPTSELPPTTGSTSLHLFSLSHTHTDCELRTSKANENESVSNKLKHLIL